MSSDDPIKVLIAHAQSLGDAWPRYAALGQTLDPRTPPAEIMRRRFAVERGEHIVGPDHWMFEIELAIVEDFRRACAACRYLATGRAGCGLTETPLPADLIRNAGLRIVRGELLLFPPRPPRPPASKRGREPKRGVPAPRQYRTLPSTISWPFPNPRCQRTAHHGTGGAVPSAGAAAGAEAAAGASAAGSVLFSCAQLRGTGASARQASVATKNRAHALAEPLHPLVDRGKVGIGKNSL